MHYPKPLSPSAALAVFHEELARAAVSPAQAAAGPALWPRFAGYYQGLARLPRKAWCTLGTLGEVTLVKSIEGLPLSEELGILWNLQTRYFQAVRGVDPHPFIELAIVSPSGTVTETTGSPTADHITQTSRR